MQPYTSSLSATSTLARVQQQSRIISDNNFKAWCVRRLRKIYVTVNGRHVEVAGEEKFKMKLISRVSSM